MGKLKWDLSGTEIRLDLNLFAVIVDTYAGVITVKAVGGNFDETEIDECDGIFEDVASAKTAGLALARKLLNDDLQSLTEV